MTAHPSRPDLIAAVKWARDYARQMAEMLRGGKSTGKREEFEKHAAGLEAALIVLAEEKKP